MNNARVSQAQQLYQRFPDNDLARFSLAQALVDSGGNAEAIPHLRALCTKKSDWMVVHILLGKCLSASGQHAEAKTIFQHALTLAIDQHHDGPRAELEDLLRSM
jgi:predicted negative regulator of RcsB-dependent stress response